MSRFLDVWRLLNAPCRDMARLASESLDREPDRLERLALRSHLVYCKGCRRYMQQIALLRATMLRLAERMETDPDPALPDDVRARIKRMLRDQTAPS
jgi:predicted anti-sigma-YlaC factor YlaD